MHALRLTAAFAILLLTAAAASAQQHVTPPIHVEAIESVSIESMARVTDAPFSAQAVTEFTQILGDGNRIERRYDSFIARDSRGRTRREEEIAMIGPLGTTGPPPRLVTILDPDAGVTYTLNEQSNTAHRNRVMTFHIAGSMIHTTRDGARVTSSQSASNSWHIGSRHVTVQSADAAASADTSESTVTTDLGTRTIEGVAATGTRTTTTIPAGTIGNLLPIEIVSERWFSEELQVPVLITRRDPRFGDTVYRLTNVSRAEPPTDLFVVPPGYDVQHGTLGANWIRMATPKKF